MTTRCNVAAVEDAGYRGMERGGGGANEKWSAGCAHSGGAVVQPYRLASIRQEEAIASFCFGNVNITLPLSRKIVKFEGVLVNTGMHAKLLSVEGFFQPKYRSAAGQRPDLPRSLQCTPTLPSWIKGHNF